MTPKVSIIVPVYNAEKVISRCVDSILEQEYTDFELLLIDDGSTDSSGKICDKYAKEDTRVRVIHKENGGVSAARNLALEEARGTYLQFLDADDWITPNATKLFVETAEQYQCDMVIADFYRVAGERVSHKGAIEKDGVLSREEFAEEMMENPADFYYGVLWNKLYRRDIIETYNLRMDARISWCEDFMFNLEYIRHCEVFYALQVPIYYYVKTKGSLVSQSMNITKMIKMKLMVFEYYNDFYKQVLTEEEYEKKRFQVYRFLLDAADDAIVLPTMMPNSKKLGKERSSASQNIVARDDILGDIYRNRKLLNYYLEPVAIKHELNLEEIRVLLGLKNGNQSQELEELADFVGISMQKLSIILPKLLQKGLVKVKKKHKEHQIEVSLYEETLPIVEELESVEKQFEQAKLAGLTAEEAKQYEQLSAKIKQNIQKIL